MSIAYIPGDAAVAINDMLDCCAVVRPGQKTTLRFRIFHPGTGEPIKKFEVVHEKPYHLFVISQDMEYFQHIHPAEQADGTWTIELTLYRLVDQNAQILENKCVPFADKLLYSDLLNLQKPAKPAPAVK